MIENIFFGISAYGQSFSLLSKLKLWKYFFIPIAISLVTAIAIGFSAYGLSDNLGVLISKLWIWEWGKQTATIIFSVVGGIGIVIIGLILYKHIVMALSAPFMSPISEKIELYLNQDKKFHSHKTTSFSEQLWRGIRINIRNLFRELFISAPLLILGFIPVLNIITTILLFVVQAYYAGFGNMDYTLERHFNYKESIELVRKNRGIAIGNGLLFIVFLFVPVIGVILVLPFSVTAASINTAKLIHNA
ncbi:MAG: coproporphyrinogen III oxidase [Flavobacteriales bacterium]|nr:MAG: coproporphyrinogen III oxidase [Flavobacteriales bacterium]